MLAHVDAIGFGLAVFLLFAVVLFAVDLAIRRRVPQQAPSMTRRAVLSALLGERPGGMVYLPDLVHRLQATLDETRSGALALVLTSEAEHLIELRPAPLAAIPRADRDACFSGPPGYLLAFARPLSGKEADAKRPMAGPSPSARAPITVVARAPRLAGPGTQ